MSSEDPWEVLALEGSISDQNEAKIQRKRTLFQNQFWFGYNFLPGTFFSIPFSQVIYIFPVLSIDTNDGHICGHIESGHNGHYGHFDLFGHYGPTRYGHKYAHYWCLWKEQEKCRSPTKTELKKLHQVKSYSQIKIDSEIMAISFVFWPRFDTKLSRLGQALPRGPQSSSLCFRNQ